MSDQGATSDVFKLQGRLARYLELRDKLMMADDDWNVLLDPDGS
jgi:hypothetical protein